MRRSTVYSLILVAIIFAQVSISGCATWDKLNTTEQGAVLGTGAGVVVGNAVAPGIGGTIVGGGLGAVTGGVIGHEVDSDRRRKR